MLGLQTTAKPSRRDRIVVSTLRCGRSNPGSNPGHGNFAQTWLFYFLPSCTSLYNRQLLTLYPVTTQLIQQAGPLRASGAMDNASDYGSEDSRFDSWLARSTL